MAREDPSKEEKYEMSHGRGFAEENKDFAAWTGPTGQGSLRI